VVSAFVDQRFNDRRRGGVIHWNAGGGLGKGREAGALGQRKFIGAWIRWRRAAAGLFFSVNDLMDAAVLEHDALAGLYVVIAAFKDTGD